MTTINPHYFRDRKILITGGSGFIGSHLVDRLVTAGAIPTLIDDLSTGTAQNIRQHLDAGKITFIQSKVSDCPALAQLAEESDTIIHLAAAVGVDLVVRSPIRTIHTNLHETEAILEAASLAGTPLLIASTSEVYGRSTKDEFHESDDLLIGPPHLGRWSYACSKLMDEFMALAYAAERNVSVRIVRFFNTVGPRQTGRYGMVIPRFVEAALAGKPLRIFGDGQQTRCFCHVHDAVEAVLRLVTVPEAAGQIVNIGSTSEITIIDLASTVIEVLESSSTLEMIPYDQAYAAGFQDMRRRRPSIDRLIGLTGFSPVRNLNTIIADTADYFRKHPTDHPTYS
jgi:UDP-glucose 4-epimerase